MRTNFYPTTSLIRNFIIGLFLLTWVGCQNQGAGFALPKGDVEAGKKAFTNLRCNDCHSIGDISQIGEAEGVAVELGGEIRKIKTYGELVTSVINPSHKTLKKYLPEGVDDAGNSKMRQYNDVMTVQQLVDIVTFLQSEYELVEPKTDYYPYGY